VLICFGGNRCGLNGGSTRDRIVNYGWKFAAVRGRCSSKLAEVIGLTISSSARGWSGCSYLYGFCVGDEDGTRGGDIGGRISRSSRRKVESLRGSLFVDTANRLNQSRLDSHVDRGTRGSDGNIYRFWLTTVVAIRETGSKAVWRPESSHH